MGAWGYKFYENDEAADWLHQFWDTKSFELLVKEVEQFDPSNENYDTIRVIAHILICFGSPYTCPEDFLDQRSIIIKRVLTILENMINPPNSDWDFLDIWDNDPEIISEVENQIIEIKKLYRIYLLNKNLLDIKNRCCIVYTTRWTLRCRCVLRRW